MGVKKAASSGRRFASHAGWEVVTSLFLLVRIDAMVRALEWMKDSVDHRLPKFVRVAVTKSPATRGHGFIRPKLRAAGIHDEANYQAEKLIEADKNLHKVMPNWRKPLLE